jgi:hypothetical protein
MRVGRSGNRPSWTSFVCAGRGWGFEEACVWLLLKKEDGDLGEVRGGAAEVEDGHLQGLTHQAVLNVSKAS